MKEISLSFPLVIPIERYAPLKPAASVTVAKREGETDKELFVRAHKLLEEVLEAETALQMSKILRIKDNEGMVSWATALAEDIGADNNKFIETYLKTMKI